MRVLVAGGGVAALEAVLALRALAAGLVKVELLAPAIEFPQKPLSVRSPFSGEPAPEASFDRVPLVHHRGALDVVDDGIVVTTDGGRLPYDRLIVATGARAVEAVHGATTFRGPVSAGAVEAALAHDRVVFAAPDASWTLPLYELALLAGRPKVTIVTPEPRPLDAFGTLASDAVARLLDRARVEFIGDTTPDAVLGDALTTRDGRTIRADAVIALPRLVPRPIGGLPEGFLEIDQHARVVGVPNVFAAGDMTAGPVKQGGLATQQADAAAERIAFEAGAGNSPRPYQPVLRALLLTGEAPLYLRSGPGGPPQVSRSPLWWPSTKVVGRYLTGYLAGGHA
jgi:sulfide:quinone oxidoreductase